MPDSDACPHHDVTCLNQHELIRKYRCKACDGVMMCGCDEEFGRRHLPHQLDQACELDTQQRLPVTLGFVQGICSECRGLPADPAPAAAIHGRTTKIKRYYWREIYFGELLAVSEWDDGHPDASDEERRTAHQVLWDQVLASVKEQHAAAPKYFFTELSQAQVIERYGVEIDMLSADHWPGGGKGRQIAYQGSVVSPEAFAKSHYEGLGWSVIGAESLPFHALFGVMMWLPIQAPSDPLNRLVGFADRAVFEETGAKSQI